MTDYKLRVKPITTPKKLPTEQQIRDTFQTPAYATKLLLPFLPKGVNNVWECAAGQGKIAQVLYEAGVNVIASDIAKDTLGRNLIANFITDEMPYPVSQWELAGEKFSIITNPPFSIKELFAERCFQYGVPFALLINADYSQWAIDLVRKGCEKIIPTRRIAFITPNILSRIHEWEVYSLLVKEQKARGVPTLPLSKYKVQYREHWLRFLSEHPDVHNYDHVEKTPGKLLKKYSSSQFHSMWLTWGLGLGQSETFVDLGTKEMEIF